MTRIFNSFLILFLMSCSATGEKVSVPDGIVVESGFRHYSGSGSQSSSVLVLPMDILAKHSRLVGTKHINPLNDFLEMELSKAGVRVVDPFSLRGDEEGLKQGLKNGSIYTVKYYVNKYGLRGVRFVLTSIVSLEQSDVVTTKADGHDVGMVIGVVFQNWIGKTASEVARSIKEEKIESEWSLQGKYTVFSDEGSVIAQVTDVSVAFKTKEFYREVMGSGSGFKHIEFVDYLCRRLSQAIVISLLDSKAI